MCAGRTKHQSFGGESMTRVLYRQKDFPVLQNRVYETAEKARACPKGDIEIVEDPRTGLIYNRAFRPELMIYDSNYNNEQSLSPHFKQHLSQVAEIIQVYLGHQSLVEVGCGKGFFLEMLLSTGADITGFDPTYEGHNPRVKREYFRSGVMNPSKGVILRHVLEHVTDPVDFLGKIKDANGGAGVIYIEVPCFDWICEKRAWFDIFYEHVNYFRMSDLHRMFSRIIASGKIFGDQYLYVVADLSSLQTPHISNCDAINFPNDFLKSLDSVEKNRVEKDPVCVWGGASKGVIFSLLRERIGKPVHTVIDVNPTKQGKFLPGTGLSVQSPVAALAKLPAGSTIYVMNSNYLDEIKEMSNFQYNYIGVDQ